MPNPYWDILLAVKASLDAVSGHPTVDIRYDVTQYDPTIDALPFIIVAPSPERQQQAGGTFGSRVFYDYPVDVVWLTDSARVAKTGLEAYLAMEWAIQDALFRVTLASVSEVFDTNQGDLVVARIPHTNVRPRGWQFKYRTDETRSGN